MNMHIAQDDPSAWVARFAGLIPAGRTLDLACGGGRHARLMVGLGHAVLAVDRDTVTKKIRTMPTDPARVRRTDSGDPEKCPVWQFHMVYSDQATRDWVTKGCKSAGIGCLECKQPVIDGILKEQEPMRERAQQYLDDPSLVRAIVADGCDQARKYAQETMRDVREEMGLSYS